MTKSPTRKTKKPLTPATAKTGPKAENLEKSMDECCPMEHAAMPQNGSIVHVEFTTPDLAKATKFYGELFGWQIHPFQENGLYFQTPGNWGPCGCINKGAAATCSATLIYVNVTSIEATIAKAKGLGASVASPKTAIPGGHGFCAEVKMPDGNVFGLYSH